MEGTISARGNRDQILSRFLPFTQLIEDNVFMFYTNNRLTSPHKMPMQVRGGGGIASTESKPGVRKG